MTSLYLIYRRIIHPIQMAQTRGGLVLAVALILCWQSSQTVLAAVANPGFSENDFFRLEWDYDLANGTGQIRFRPNIDGMGEFFADYWGLSPELEHRSSFIQLDMVEFRSYGIPFDSVTMGGNPTLIDTPGEPTIYQYREDGASPNSYFFADSFGGYSEMVIDVTFPMENIGLVDSSLGYGGVLSAAYSESTNTGYPNWSLSGFFGETTPSSGAPVLSEQDTINFVSVQQIPEPGTAALLVSGAAVAGLRGRVRRGLGKLLKGKADA